MSRIRPLIFALLLGVPLGAAVVSAARAADMPGDYSLPMPADLPRKPVFSALHGWYLRGDLGYRLGKVSGVDVTPAGPTLTDSKLDGAIDFSIGGGLKLDWFRTDLTLDYAAPAKFHATSNPATPDDVTAKIQALSLMMNGYVDLGTWYGFTPYVGAGVGAAFLRVGDYQSIGVPPASQAAAKDWNLTYAAMAGVAFAVSRNMMLDVGYRYHNLGNAPMLTDATGSLQVKDIAAHEIRFGLRWYFDDFADFR